MKAFFTADEIKSYERDGFIVVPQMYSDSEMATISAAVDELVAQSDVIGRHWCYFEDSLLSPGERILSRIEKFVEFQPDLSGLVYSDRMIGRLTQLFGEPALLFKEKINFKLPGGAGFTPHQDLHTGWDDYCSFFISVLVAIDDSTVENGCLELAAGHHKRGMLGERWKPLSGADLEGIDFVKYPMKAGDVAFFDCYVPHQSQANLTEKPRRNLYLTYNPASEGDERERYFADKYKNYPPDLERLPGHDYSYKV